MTGQIMCSLHGRVNGMQTALESLTLLHITFDPPVSNAPVSKLGADLRAIRKRIEASGIPLLSKEEILEEIHARRGGYREQDE